MFYQYEDGERLPFGVVHKEDADECYLRTREVKEENGVIDELCYALEDLTKAAERDSGANEGVYYSAIADAAWDLITIALATDKGALRLKMLEDELKILRHAHFEYVD